MPLDSIMSSLREVGSGIWLVFAVTPLWFAMNAVSLGALIKNRVSFVDLMYNQLVGEAINVIVPLAGLAGEPYKAKHLSNWIPLQEASRAIVHNKLIHAFSGPLFTSIVGAIVLWLVPMSPAMFTSIAIVSTGMAVGAIALILVALSKAPDKLTGFVLTKLKVLGSFRHDRVDPKLFALSCFYKMIGRFMSLIEVVVILHLLDIPLTAGTIFAIEAFISASGVIFLFVPQGIGVNEAGAAGAFALLGLSAPLALTYGLLRRARVVFWAFAGFLLHLVVSGVQQASRAVGEAIGK
jgi:hypothetical protein